MAFQPTDRAWIDALRHGARALPDDPLVHLFREVREELLVSRGSDGGTQARHGLLTGLALRGTGGGGGTRFVAAPSLDDLWHLLGGGDPARRPPSPGRDDAPPAALALDPRAVPPLLDRLLSAVARACGALPHACRAEWVAVRQEVAIARGDSGVVLDTRQGSHLRAVLALEGDASADASASVETPRDVQSLAERLVARALARRDGRPAATGTTDVVFMSGAGGVVLHELVGHALEGGAAAWAPEAPADGVRVLDDPRRAHVAWTIDDQGEPTREVELAGGGGLGPGLHDLASARRTGAPAAGHGRCSSFAETVHPRMGCTYLAAGSLSPDDLLADTRRGVLVHRIQSAHAELDEAAGVFRVTDADLLEGGRAVGPLRPFLLRIDARRALRAIDAVASDLSFDGAAAACVRHGQAIPVTVGSPTFRMRSLELLC